MYSKFKQPHHMHMSVIYNNFDNVGVYFTRGALHNNTASVLTH